jgi:hypothetical protein
MPDYCFSGKLNGVFAKVEKENSIRMEEDILMLNFFVRKSGYRARRQKGIYFRRVSTIAVDN